jgi:hypothetical protein
MSYSQSHKFLIFVQNVQYKRYNPGNVNIVKIFVPMHSLNVNNVKKCSIILVIHNTLSKVCVMNVKICPLIITRKSNAFICKLLPN